MGGGFIFIAIVAIICGTVIKLRKLQIEKEQLGSGHTSFDTRKSSKSELAEINKRLENLEMIVAAGDLSTLPEGHNTKEMKEQIKLLSRRISELEQERFKDGPY